MDENSRNKNVLAAGGIPSTIATLPLCGPTFLSLVYFDVSTHIAYNAVGAEIDLNLCSRRRRIYGALLFLIIDAVFASPFRVDWPLMLRAADLEANGP